MNRTQFLQLPQAQQIVALCDQIDALNQRIAAMQQVPAVAAAAPAPAVQDKTGFDLADSNGNWLKNEFEGTKRFAFNVREGQRKVEVTMGVEHDMGGYSYSLSVIRDDGLQVETGHGYGGNGIVKLLDFIGKTQQRGGAESIGQDWPHGGGRFHIDLTVSKRQVYAVQYNHD